MIADAKMDADKCEAPATSSYIEWDVNIDFGPNISGYKFRFRAPRDPSLQMHMMRRWEDEEDPGVVNRKTPSEQFHSSARDFDLDPQTATNYTEKFRVTHRLFAATL